MLLLPSCKHLDGSQISFDFCPIQFKSARFSIRNETSINSKANSPCKGKVIMDVGQYENCTPKVRFAQKHDFFEMAAILTLLACEKIKKACNDDQQCKTQLVS